MNHDCTGQVFIFNLVLITRDAMVCRKGLFEQAPTQRAVRDCLKFAALVEKNIETLVALKLFVFFNTYCNIEGRLLVKYFIHPAISKK